MLLIFSERNPGHATDIEEVEPPAWQIPESVTFTRENGGGEHGGGEHGGGEHGGGEHGGGERRRSRGRITATQKEVRPRSLLSPLRIRTKSPEKLSSFLKSPFKSPAKSSPFIRSPFKGFTKVPPFIRSPLKPKNRMTGFPCRSCTLNFQSKHEREQHVREKHQTDTIHLCSFCGKQFTSKKSCKQHMQLHTSALRCSSCHKKFNTMQEKQTHKEQFHSKLFECDLCGKKYSRKADVNRHKKTHEAKVTCDVCNVLVPYPIVSHYQKSHPEIWAQTREFREVVLTSP